MNPPVIDDKSKVYLRKDGLNHSQANSNCSLPLETVLRDYLVEVLVLIFHLKALLNHLEVINEIIHVRSEIKIRTMYFFCFDWNFDPFCHLFFQADCCFWLLYLLYFLVSTA